MVSSVELLAVTPTFVALSIVPLIPPVFEVEPSTIKLPLIVISDDKPPISTAPPPIVVNPVVVLNTLTGFPAVVAIISLPLTVKSPVIVASPATLILSPIYTIDIALPIVTGTDDDDVAILIPSVASAASNVKAPSASISILERPAPVLLALIVSVFVAAELAVIVKFVLSVPSSDNIVPSNVIDVLALISTPPATEESEIADPPVPLVLTIRTCSYAGVTEGAILTYASPKAFSMVNSFSSATFIVIPPAVDVNAIEELSVP